MIRNFGKTRVKCDVSHEFHTPHCGEALPNSLEFAGSLVNKLPTNSKRVM